MNCKTCAYYDEENIHCTHLRFNTRPTKTIIKYGCSEHKEIEQSETERRTQEYDDARDDEQ